MPSASLIRWQTDRANRISQVEGHCREVELLVPANPTFLDETLRGYVLHLSAHFQGFCRDLYTECSLIWIRALPVGFGSIGRSQCFTQLAMEKANPSYENLKRDFNRFGFQLNLLTASPDGPRSVTDLGHLNDWRNRAAHQANHPFVGGVPQRLTLTILNEWQKTCERLASVLDGIMYNELTAILTAPPW